MLVGGTWVSGEQRLLGNVVQEADDDQRGNLTAEVTEADQGEAKQDIRQLNDCSQRRSRILSNGVKQEARVRTMK